MSRIYTGLRGVWGKFKSYTPKSHTCDICGKSWSHSVDKCDCMVEKYCGMCGMILPECYCSRYRTEHFEGDIFHTELIDSGVRKDGDVCMRCLQEMTKCKCQKIFCPFCGDPVDTGGALPAEDECHCGRSININEITEA